MDHVQYSISPGNTAQPFLDGAYGFEFFPGKAGDKNHWLTFDDFQFQFKDCPLLPCGMLYAESAIALQCLWHYEQIHSGKIKGAWEFLKVALNGLPLGVFWIPGDWDARESFWPISNLY